MINLLRCALVAFVCALALATSGSAEASSVFLSPVQGGYALTYLAAPGEENVTTVSPENVITESAPGVVMSGCNAVANVATCAPPGGSEIVVISVIAGDQDDIVVVAPANEVPANLFGQAGNDTLVGGLGNDSLLGSAGDDVIDGGGVLGGYDTADYSDAPGPVTVTLQNPGVQQNTGSAGLDVLKRINFLKGGTFGDTLTGGDSTETLQGLGGNDVLDGKDLGDTLQGGPGSDTIADTGFGIGYDTADYSDHSTTTSVDLDAAPGDDGSAGTDGPALGSLDTVGPGIEAITGGSGNDTLTGNSSANAFDGGPGADIFNGLGDVTDRVSYASRSAAVTATIGAGSNDGEVGEGDTLAADIEFVTGGSGDDVLTGNPNGANVSNTLEGGVGSDTLNGNDGADRLSGGVGGDTLNGGDGNDPALDGDEGDDDVNGGNGNDIIGSSLILAGMAGDGADTITGGPGTDTASYASRQNAVLLSIGGGADDGGLGEHDDIGGDVENLVGSGANDTLVGDAGPNLLAGASGLDLLRGGGGDDQIDGGENPDTVDYSDAPAAVTIDLAAVGAQNTGAAGSDTLLSIENARGSAHADSLTGSSSENVLKGLAGVDLLKGAASDDTLEGGADNDTLQGGPGTADIVSYADRSSSVAATLDDQQPGELPDGDPLAGENDAIAADVEGLGGGAAGDDLVGNALANVLDGGDGNDDLNGGLGSDKLVGGAGIHDLVSYGGHSADVNANLDGLPGDGNAGSGESDTIATDVEDLTGGSGDDSLTGDAGANVLDGGFGADQLNGGSGEDTAAYASRASAVTVSIDGQPDDGNADDQSGGLRDNVQTDIENVVGGSGNDTFSGPAGVSNGFDGGPGSDTSSYAARGAAVQVSLDGVADDGEPGENDDADTENAVGGDGADTLTGANGVANRLEGGPGADLLDGRTGPDLLSGGDGTDLVDYSARGAAVGVTPDGSANDGEAGEGDSVLDDVESVRGGGGNDALTGNNGAGTLEGGPGDDLLDGGLGSDGISGGPGSDSASYATRPEAINVDLTSAGGDGAASEGDDIQTDVEALVGGSGPDQLGGGPGANALIGAGGDDSLAGAEGDDRLQGGDGNDSLDGGAGNDGLSGGDGADQLRGGGERDVLDGDSGDDALDGGAGSDTFNGGAGSDTADYSARTASLAISIDGSPDDGESGEQDNVRGDVENVAAGHGNDTISGSADFNSIDAGAGNDRIEVVDEMPDRVLCGVGDDIADADSSDSLDGCEKVTRASATIALATRTARLKGKAIALTLRCESRKAACDGTLTLRSADKRKTKVGSASFSVPAGAAKSVKVKVSSKARRTITRKGKLRTTASITPQAGGGEITIKAAKANKKKKRSR